MNRPSSKLELVVVAALMAGCTIAGCTVEGTSRFPTASELPEGDRRPDGVAVDLTSEPPGLQDRAATDERVVTLRAPLDISVALTVVRTFFDSVLAEDPNVMSNVVDPSALLQDTQLTTQAAYNGATTVWRQRFYDHDYTILASSLIYRESDVISFQGASLGRLPMSVRYLQPDVPGQPTDVVLQVPIVTHTVKAERFMGTEMFFWLRREGDRYIIYRIAEDVPL